MEDDKGSPERVVQRFAMARGTVVVDENVQNLADILRKINIRCIVPSASTPDTKIITELLPNRIFITRNTKHFKLSASSYDFGIISLADLNFLDDNPDPTQNKTVQLISRAFIEHSLWSKRHGFIVTLSDNGKIAYQDLID